MSTWGFDDSMGESILNSLDVVYLGDENKRELQ